MGSPTYLRYNMPSIIWAAFVLYLSLMPAGGIPRIAIPHIDKVVHFCLYTIWAVCTAYGWQRQQQYGTLHQYTFIKIWVLLTTFGLGIECLQEYMAWGRHFEWADAIVNASGAIMGLIGWNTFCKTGNV